MQLYWQDIPKSNSTIPAIRSIENSWLIILKKTRTDFYTVLKINWDKLSITLNSINLAIDLVMQYSKNDTAFASILIMHNETCNWIDPYHKLINIQRCLPFLSSHLNHCMWMFWNYSKQCPKFYKIGKPQFKPVQIPSPRFSNQTRNL